MRISNKLPGMSYRQWFLWLVIVVLSGCSHQPLQVSKVYYGASNGSVSPNYQWSEGYTVTKKGLVFERYGHAKHLNSGEWLIQSFGDEEQALFDTLSDPNTLKVKLKHDPHMVGGSAGYYEVNFEDGRSVHVSAGGSGATYYHQELLLEPIRSYLSRVELPESVLQRKIKPPSMSVYFSPGSHHIDPPSEVALKEIASYLLFQARRGDLLSKVIIEGHTDKRGSRGYNVSFGKRRADAVKEHLVALGVPAESIEAVSFGEERLVCVNGEESCHAQNRRVEIVLR